MRTRPLRAGRGIRRPSLATGPALASTLASPKNDTPDMQPIEFTRLMDSASIRLMNYLTTCTTLPSISIVKRKAAGTRNWRRGLSTAGFHRRCC